MQPIALTLVYPTKTVEHMVTELELTTEKGLCTILYGHAPLYAALKENSSLSLTTDSKEQISIPVVNGIASVDRSSIRIILTKAP